jgi:glyoxylase-like metal-dependent hydrolase (beta-lactamase superfamily II)
MFPNLTPADFNGLVDSNGIPYLTPTGNFVDPVSYSGTLINSMGKWILVDDGLGSLVPSTQPTRIPQGIETIVPLTEINYVILTHFHTDHTGWNVNAPQNTIEFPNAQYIAQTDEIDYWSSTPALRNQSNFQNLIQPVINAGLLHGITGRLDITDEVSTFPCKGHTPGHQCVFIISGGKDGIIMGDSMHRNFQVQRPDWSAVYDWNTNFSVPLRVGLVNEIGENNMTMIASHFLFPGVGNLAKEVNPLPNSSGWVFVPVPS